MAVMETFHTTTLPHIQCVRETSLHSLNYIKFPVDEENLHKERCCAHTDQTEHVCWFFLHNYIFYRFFLRFCTVLIWFILSLYFLRTYLDLDVTIAAEVLIMLVHGWYYMETIQTVHGLCGLHSKTYQILTSS